MNFRSHFLSLAAVLWVFAPAAAAVVTQNVKYSIDGVEYVGFVAHDDQRSAKKPGILIAPEWIGVNDYARGRAKQLAEMGYVAFVFDPYGGGKNAADPKQASEWSGALKADRPELRKRISAGLETLKKQDRVDTTKIAAVGYCFGGTTVLELARSGADIAGVVSFHGGLSTTLPAKAGEVKAKVLVCHGAIDPFVSPEEVAAFEKEMQDAKADWQLVKYGNAVHSFTNPAAKGQVPGAEYNENADRRSWEAMKVFMQELFAAGKPPALNQTGAAQRIVYVCDASATTINAMGWMKTELVRSVAPLEASRQFNVLFFTDGGKYYVASKDGLITATPFGKRDVYVFLEDVSAGKVLEAEPLRALRAAFDMKPDLVYFVVSSESMGLRTLKSVNAELERLNPNRNVRVEVVAFDLEGGNLDRDTLTVLAEDNGGRFRLVQHE